MLSRASRLLFAVAVAFVLAFGSRTARAANWYDGAPSRVQHVCNNFITTTTEDLVWTWVGFQDVNDVNGPRLPKTGETYYVRVVMGGLGCSGAWVHPELKLPKGTSIAITGQNPMRCFVDRPNQAPRQPLPCPAAPLPGVYPNGQGFYAFDPPNNQPYWALPNGNIIYIEVPVTSTLPLSGIATNDYAVAAVNIIDNNPGGGNPPWDNPNPPSSGPWQGVFVTQNGAPRSPYVSYADKGAIATKDTATTDVTINNYDCAVSGQLVTDVLPVVNQVDATQYVSAACIAGCCTGPCPQGASVTYRYNWSTMTPDRDYKWRGYLQNLVVANGCARDLADAQTNAQAPQWAYFKTLPLVAKPAQYSLLLHVTGSGGALAATPALASGQTRYQPGTKVTVTAQPSAGYEVKTVAIDGTVATLPTSVTMDQDHAVEATFALLGAVDPDAGDTDAGADGGSTAPAASSDSGGCSQSGGSGTGSAALLGFALALVMIRRRRD